MGPKSAIFVLKSPVLLTFLHVLPENKDFSYDAGAYLLVNSAISADFVLLKQNAARMTLVQAQNTLLFTRFQSFGSSFLCSSLNIHSNYTRISSCLTWITTILGPFFLFSGPFDPILVQLHLCYSLFCTFSPNFKDFSCVAGAYLLYFLVYFLDFRAIILAWSLNIMALRPVIWICFERSESIIGPSAIHLWPMRPFGPNSQYYGPPCHIIGFKT